MVFKIIMEGTKFPNYICKTTGIVTHVHINTQIIIQMFICLKAKSQALKKRTSVNSCVQTPTPAKPQVYAMHGYVFTKIAHSKPCI